jgi:hypothetical protein
MLRLAPLAVIILALVGCDLTVQARYQPTTVEEVFGAQPMVSGVAADMHELPATPPAIHQTGLSKRSNRRPGVTLKPTDMVGVRDSRARVSSGEPTLQGGWHEPPMRSPPPGPAYRIATYSFRQEEIGAKESIATPIEPSTLRPGRSIYRAEPTLMGAYRSDAYSYGSEDANRR